MKLLSRYYTDTPKKWRKIGDALLITGTAITTGALLEYDKLTGIFSPQHVRVIIIIAFIAGVAGKFLTNFFSPDITPSTNVKETK